MAQSRSRSPNHTTDNVVGTSNWSNFGRLSRRAGLSAIAGLSCYCHDNTIALPRGTSRQFFCCLVLTSSSMFAPRICLEMKTLTLTVSLVRILEIHCLHIYLVIILSVFNSWSTIHCNLQTILRLVIEVPVDALRMRVI